MNVISRIGVAQASHRNELLLKRARPNSLCRHEESSCQRDAGTNRRDACSTRRFQITIALIFSLLLPLRAEEKPSPVQTLIPWLLKEDQSFTGIPFSEVIAATSGRKIIPFDPMDADDQRILAKIGEAMDEVLRQANAPDSEMKTIKRINEAGNRFENLMQTTLNAMPEFTCDFPPTTSGRVQRSGYPDLRLVDKATGRVCYIDPKLYATGNRNSSFRSFYFEPKRDTNKVNDDAHHLVVGIAHDRDEIGWRFLRWELVDLTHFRVKLKAEFQGSNHDMYQPEAIIGSSPK